MKNEMNYTSVIRRKEAFVTPKEINIFQTQQGKGLKGPLGVS